MAPQSYPSSEVLIVESLAGTEHLAQVIWSEHSFEPELPYLDKRIIRMQNMEQDPLWGRMWVKIATLLKEASFAEVRAIAK